MEDIAVTNLTNNPFFQIHINRNVSAQAIIVGRPARLKCNYVKYRTESVRQIKWFAGYKSSSGSSFRSKIFDFAVTTGKKETTPLAFIRVDEASATEEELTMTLTEFRDPNMTISCEVEVVRDNGYGKLRHSKKLGESPIRWPISPTRGYQTFLD